MEIELTNFHKSIVFEFGTALWQIFCGKALTLHKVSDDALYFF